MSSGDRWGCILRPGFKLWFLLSRTLHLSLRLIMVDWSAGATMVLENWRLVYAPFNWKAFNWPPCLLFISFIARYSLLVNNISNSLLGKFSLDIARLLPKLLLRNFKGFFGRASISIAEVLVKVFIHHFNSVVIANIHWSISLLSHSKFLLVNLSLAWISLVNCLFGTPLVLLSNLLGVLGHIFNWIELHCLPDPASHRSRSSHAFNVAYSLSEACIDALSRLVRRREHTESDLLATQSSSSLFGFRVAIVLFLSWFLPST